MQEFVEKLGGGFGYLPRKIYKSRFSWKPFLLFEKFSNENTLISMRLIFGLAIHLGRIYVTFEFLLTSKARC